MTTDGKKGAGRPIGELEAARARIAELTRTVESYRRLVDGAAKCRTFLEAAPDPLFALTPEGRISFATRALAEAFGKPDEDIVGKSLWDVFPKEEADRRFALLCQVIRSGKETTLEERVPRADGDRYYQTAIKPLKDPAGNMVSAICASRDITAPKQADERLVKLSQLVPGVIYQYRLFPDGRSCFPYSSSGMNDIYEVTPEEVREDATPVFGRLHPDELASTTAAIHESARTLALFHWEFRVVLPRQGLRWRECSATPERLSDGGTLWHGIITDISDRKRAEEEKARLEGQLQQSQRMESVGRLAGGVAHDFNNMLGAILGHAELAMEQVAPELPLYDDLVEIQKAARRSADLTRQLLAFARKQTVAPKVLDLNMTVDGMLKMLQRLIGEDIHLSWKPDAQLWPVKVDPSQIDQILANLCVNARDAIADVGEITIETGNSTFDAEYCSVHADVVPGEYVRLAVSDTGTGMDRETLSHLFEPFFTTKGVGEGTGLGLATVYGAVKQNNGFVHVDSEPGRGTTFTIYLPRNSAECRDAEAAVATEPTLRGHETVLVVEDEPAILSLAKRMLGRQGYGVLAAGSPSEALRLAGEYQGAIHLLMTDVVMPGMNGRDLAKSLLVLHPSLKCLFMSGYTANVIAHHGVLGDKVSFIEKPFSMSELAAKVRAALDSGSS
ncbi:MAG: PAS domain-containing protein [Deltaproteobacteria bacterium]|nr:PAS domain-containing protein [Deltaproteobacteria bacterium]